jgi:hypothetical protein
MAIHAPALNSPFTLGTTITIIILFSGWVIQLVAVSYGQSRADNSPFASFANGERAPHNIYSWDWWLFSYFTVLNLFFLGCLITDRKQGNVVKYRIPASVYSIAAFVFSSLRCNTLVFVPDTEWTIVAQSLFAGYIILAVGYAVVPWFFGTSFLSTVASDKESGSPRDSTHGMVQPEMGQTQGAQGYQATPAPQAATDVPLHA